MSTALSAAVLVMCARDSLSDARRLIGEAMTAQERAADNDASEERPRSPRVVSELARARSLLAEARAIIASARELYAKAMAQLAKAGKLTHHYAEVSNQEAFLTDGYGRFRALVRIDGMTVAWLSPRTYGKRQSAQRAALAHVRKLATAGACAGAMA